MKTIVICVLLRNNHVTKLCLALHLVGIYIEYMYMYVHMCIMNLLWSVGGFFPF